jgi:hypothetical protein
MAVWFMRRLQWLLCEESMPIPAEIAGGAENPRTPTIDCRNKALRTRERAHALHRGGTIAL